ncbi:PA3715 family protein [Paraburkholderia diazotrophica]
MAIQCKSWLQKARLDIIVRPYAYTIVTEAGSDHEPYLGMVVAVVDEDTGTVLGKMNEKHLMTVDAIEPREIDIDTANYKVSDNELAFGIRVTRRNQSGVNPYSEQIMNLYILTVNDLKAIARRLLTASYGGEGDRKCVFTGVATKVFIDVIGSKSNGYSELVARTKTTPIRYVSAGEVCHKIEKNPVMQSYVLKFDGQSYRIPKPLQASLD